MAGKDKYPDFDAKPLDDEEREFMEAVEKEDFVPIENFDERKAQLEQIARNTLKKKPVTVRLQQQDIQRIKILAHEKGMPYQTLLSSIIHQYATGRLKESS